MAEGLHEGLRQAVNMKQSDELLDHVIEQNFRLIERLRNISSKSERRKKQIAHLTKGIIKNKDLKQKLDLAERGNIERTRQINLYANDLSEAKARHDDEVCELLEALQTAEDVIRKLTNENDRLKEVKEFILIEPSSNISIEEEVSVWTRVKTWFNR